MFKFLYSRQTIKSHDAASHAAITFLSICKLCFSSGITFNHLHQRKSLSSSSPIKNSHLMELINFMKTTHSSWSDLVLWLNNMVGGHIT